VDDVGPHDEATQRETGAQIEMVTHAQRMHHDAGGVPFPCERPIRIRRQLDHVAAGRELPQEAEDLYLSPAPPALGIDVQDPHVPGASSAFAARRSRPSITQAASATSLSPNVYCVRPPTMKPTIAAQGPRSASRRAGSRAIVRAAQPRPSATA